ncbi:MAG: hypothetical protein JXP34_15650 [Planctomycetes bacterium]|nr:hypothetical protein [Planctomycetota bacterium]
MNAVGLRIVASGRVEEGADMNKLIIAGGLGVAGIVAAIVCSSGSGSASGNAYGVFAADGVSYALHPRRRRCS